MITSWPGRGQVIWAAGARRTFHLYRPAALAGPAPLVVMLHGGFGTGLQAERAYGWNAAARAAGFVVAYPDGLDRIYATGMSNGGMLAYRLACETRIFAAIGPVAATQLSRSRSPAPVSVIHIHGTADRNVPFGGGTGQGFARIQGPAIPLLNATWRSVNQCGAPSVSSSGLVTTSIARGPAGRAVELITVHGAGHQWPGSVPPAPLAARLLHLDQPSTALDATKVIWRFFASHHRAAHPG